MLRIYLTIFSILALSNLANAQVIKAESNNDNYKASISNYDSNHISIAGGFIITAIAPEDGRVVMDKDEDSGTIFLRINKGVMVNNKPFTVFIRDSKKNSYSLLLSPSDIPGTNIVLEPSLKTKKAGFANKALRRDEVIQYIMENMILKQPMRMCKKSEVSLSIKLWKGTTFKELTRYECGKYLGHEYSLLNKSNKLMRIAEQEFYRSGTVSVSVSQAEIKAKSKQPVSIFVIDEVSHGK